MSVTERGMRLESLAVDVVPKGCTLRPLRDQIVVRVIDFNWSDILIETYRGRPVQGEVIAVGPGKHPYIHKRGEKDGKRFHTIVESKQYRAPEVKPGDIVNLGGLELNGYGFQAVWMDGQQHIVCSEQDVAAVRE